MNRIGMTGLALALLAVWPPALAAPSAARKSWEISTWTWIKRKPAERGVPASGQPVRVDAAALERALGDVRVDGGSGEEALFSPEECASLGPAMAAALAVAGPDEDLEVVSTEKRPGDHRADTLTVTATAFAVDGKLNLIVRDARLDFLFPYHLNPQQPDFRFGSRSAAGSAVLRAPGAESPRPDWLILPLPAPPIQAATPAGQPQAPKGVAQAPPGVEERLTGLKRFRDLNLITEEEYTRKKQEILKDY